MELLISFNNPSVTIKVTTTDGNNYKLLVLLKSKRFYNPSKFVLTLPSNQENQDLYKRGGNLDFLVYLQKLVIYYSRDLLYPTSCGDDLRRSLVVVPKHREFVEQENFPIGKLELKEDIKEENSDDDDEGENILENSHIMKMMEKMGYKRGEGLGRQSRGTPSYVLDHEIRTQNHTHGIGYRSTIFDYKRQKQIRFDKAQARKEGVPFDYPMRPYPLTLNGQFTRPGDKFPYWGFRERVIVATGWDT